MALLNCLILVQCSASATISDATSGPTKLLVFGGFGEFLSRKSAQNSSKIHDKNPSFCHEFYPIAKGKTQLHLFLTLSFTSSPILHLFSQSDARQNFVSCRGHRSRAFRAPETFAASTADSVFSGRKMQQRQHRERARAPVRVSNKPVRGQLHTPGT